MSQVADVLSGVGNRNRLKWLGKCLGAPPRAATAMNDEPWRGGTDGSSIRAPHRLTTAMNDTTSAEKSPSSQSRQPAPRRGDRRRWQVLLLTVVFAAAGGFLAGIPFWFQQSDLSTAGAEQAGGSLPAPIDQSWRNEPAFSPQATADQLKAEALRIAERLLADFPQKVEALNTVARLHLSLGQMDEAVDLWQQCLQLDPDFVDAYFGIGLVAFDRGQFPRAVEMFQKVWQLVPSELRAPVLLAQAYMRQSKLQEAVNVLEESLRTQKPSVEAVANLGQAYLQQGKLQLAKRAFEALVEGAPEHASGYYGLARVYARLGEREKSRQYLKKFRQLSKVDQQEVVRYVRESSDLATVRNIVVQVFVEAGQVYRDYEQPAMAELLWQKATVVDADNVDSRRRLLALYDAQHRNAEAASVCEQLCKLEPENAEHWLNLALLNGRLNRRQEALEAIGRAIDLEPKNSRYRRIYELLQH